MKADNDLPPGLYICRVGDVLVEQLGHGVERWDLGFVVSHMPHAGRVAAVMVMIGRSWVARLGVQDKPTIALGDLGHIVQLVQVRAKGNSLVDETPEEFERISTEVLGAEELLSQCEAVQSYREVMAERLAELFGQEQR